MEPLSTKQEGSVFGPSVHPPGTRLNAGATDSGGDRGPQGTGHHTHGSKIGRGPGGWTGVVGEGPSPVDGWTSPPTLDSVRTLVGRTTLNTGVVTETLWI